MDLEKCSENILKTGFALEFRVSEYLRNGGWSVINNKYYIDDQQEIVREIDLVAYKATKIESFIVYTTLIISCKKDEQNVWALLSKNININDPNAEWKPLHIWSNNKALNFIISQPNWNNDYYKYINEVGIKEALCPPNVHIFAFQQMDDKSKKPHNDKDIFNSITTLMKAQSYELHALPKRKTRDCIYQFNLISVLEGEMVRLHFTEGNNVSTNKIDQENYIAGYIIKKEETFARIHFIKESTFANVLNEYALLHEANCSLFKETYKEFYKKIVFDPKKLLLFKKIFTVEIKGFLYCRFQIINQRKFEKIGSINLKWNDRDKVLEIDMDIFDNEASSLNKNEALISFTKHILKNILKYEGVFQFTSDGIPF